MNKIQVYGLQKSGTNFIEWTLIHNFSVKYDSSISVIGNVEGDQRFGEAQSLKHCYPNLNNGSPLIIQRDYDIWNHSISRAYPKCNFTREVYNYYYNTPIRENWDNSEYLLIKHEWAVKNYSELLELISKRFNCEYRENWKQPMKRTSNDGGKTLIRTPYRI